MVEKALAELHVSVGAAHLCSSQDVDDRFGVVAVVVRPHVGDGGEGRRRRRGQDGRYGVRLRGLEYLLLHVALRLRTSQKKKSDHSSACGFAFTLYDEWLECSSANLLRWFENLGQKPFRKRQ